MWSEVSWGVLKAWPQPQIGCQPSRVPAKGCLLSEHTVQLGSHEETRASWKFTLPRHSLRKPGGFRAMMVGKVDIQGLRWLSKVFFSQVFAT